MGGFFRFIRKFIAPILCVAATILIPALAPAVATFFNVPILAGHFLASSAVGAFTSLLTGTSVWRGAIVGGITGAATHLLSPVFPLPSKAPVTGENTGMIKAAQSIGSRFAKAATIGQVKNGVRVGLGKRANPMNPKGLLLDSIGSQITDTFPMDNSFLRSTTKSAWDIAVAKVKPRDALLNQLGQVTGEHMAEKYFHRHSTSQRSRNSQAPQKETQSKPQPQHQSAQSKSSRQTKISKPARSNPTNQAPRKSPESEEVMYNNFKNYLNSKFNEFLQKYVVPWFGDERPSASTKTASKPADRGHERGQSSDDRRSEHAPSFSLWPLSTIQTAFSRDSPFPSQGLDWSHHVPYGSTVKFGLSSFGFTPRPNGYHANFNGFGMDQDYNLRFERAHMAFTYDDGLSATLAESVRYRFTEILEDGYYGIEVKHSPYSKNCLHDVSSDIPSVVEGKTIDPGNSPFSAEIDQEKGCTVDKYPETIFQYPIFPGPTAVATAVSNAYAYASSSLDQVSDPIYHFYEEHRVLINTIAIASAAAIFIATGGPIAATAASTAVRIGLGVQRLAASSLALRAMAK